MTDTCILIPSCDAFSDVHAPFLECFKRYWPDCPCALHTMSESGWGENPIAVGQDKGWAGNLLHALKVVQTKYVLMWLDDMLLCDPVEKESVEKASRLIREPGIVAVRLGPGAETFAPLPTDKMVGRILASSMYRISTSPTLWNVEYLSAILRSPSVSTPWEFEIAGTTFSKILDGDVLKILDEPIPIRVLYTSITRNHKTGISEWEEGALQWLRRIDVEVKTDRPIKGREPHQRWPL